GALLHFTADSGSALHLQEDKRERTNSLPDSPTASNLCPDTLHYFLVARREDKEGAFGANQNPDSGGLSWTFPSMLRSGNEERGSPAGLKEQDHTAPT
ncbi:hypothetical protein KUCAC02_012641, partial [Chaenocephalus aceratus]